MELEKIFIEDVKHILRQARNQVLYQVNNLMVNTYYEIGKKIVEQEQFGKQNAAYGTFLIENLAKSLTLEFGKGFSKRNLELIRKFYLTYRNAKSPISQSIGWTHYIYLMRIENENERQFYEIETHANNWSVRELERQIDSALYERLAVSKDKEAIKQLSKKGQIIEKPSDIIKDPYILEFVGLPEQAIYSESKLENQLISQLEKFLLELGKGFAFVGRQVRFTFDEEHFKVDLVFYNRLIRCFVLIDLKIGKLKHQDLGQMQMYVNYYDRFIKTEEENKTIGILLCKDKKDTLVEISLPESNNQIFASKYQTILPSKEEWKKWIEMKA
ncbi:MAG: PDDEXK nuclease domain-containing protein [Cytophagales bacterium]|nr:PDDEXK nuclease domain-containing protein [Cytophagales bacterium]